MTRAFSVITADPPWHCNDQLPGKGRGARKHYKTMTTDAIAAMATDPGARMASFRFPPIAEDAILFLWRLSAMADDALYVIQQWGFKTKSELVWNKHRPCKDCLGQGGGMHTIGARRRRWTCDHCDGTGCGTKWFGMGRYVRNSHETCVIATRGKMASRIQNHAIRSTMDAPVPWNWETNRAIHSAKPERFYTEIVEELARGPYVELFGRRRRPGWTVLGNQVGKLQKVA